MLRLKVLCCAASLSLAAGVHAGANCPWDCGDGDGDVGIVDFLALLAEWGQVGTPCDFDNDGVGIVDFLELLANWGPCPFNGACCNPGDGACVVQLLADCNAAGGVFGGDGTDCTDTDNDRIPDAFELNTCQPEGACFSGTDPNDIDTDDDFISDGDELYGTTGGLDLPAMGADPCHKDLFVETDWVWSGVQDPDRNKFHVNQVTRIVTTFAASGVANPDGVPGITLHIDYGQAPYTGGNAVEDDDSVIEWGNGNTEFYQIKGANFASNRHQYFHYCLMADGYDNAPGPSPGFAERPGDDFVVTLGQWDITGDVNGIGNIFMHELGHNLSLFHGGNDGTNHKPNYNSVMNYRYSFCGADGDSDSIGDDIADYSHGLNINLDELALVEADGVTGIGPAIDWNGSGAIDGGTIARNINCPVNATAILCTATTPASSECGRGVECFDQHCATGDGALKDYDDWALVTLSGVFNADFAPVEIIFCSPESKVLVIGGGED